MEYYPAFGPTPAATRFLVKEYAIYTVNVVMAGRSARRAREDF